MKFPPIYLGHNSDNKPVHIDGAGRGLHAYVAGSTGSGKTELLKILMDYDIRQGSAVVVIDPHTDLGEQVAHWPGEELHSRLVYLKPGLFPDAVPALNPLQLPKGATGRTKNKIAARMGEVIGEIVLGSGGADMSVRMTSVATVCCRVLLDRPGATLKDLRNMLGSTPPPALIKAGENHAEAGISEFFRNEWSSGTYEASKDAVRVRLASLLLHSDFRELTCGNGHTPLYDLVDAGKVVLFSLGAMGEDVAEVVGKMVLCMMAALGDMRKEVERGDRRPVHIYVDECQVFTGGAAMTTILSQLRKYGIRLTLANQHVGMFKVKEQRDAVLTNCQAKFLGTGDAPGPMAAAMGCDLEDAQSIALRSFLAKWGHEDVFQFRTRSDLADESARCTQSQWIARKLRQRPYYSTGGPAASVGAAQADTAPEGFSRELD